MLSLHPLLLSLLVPTSYVHPRTCLCLLQHHYKVTFINDLFHSCSCVLSLKKEVRLSWKNIRHKSGTAWSHCMNVLWQFSLFDFFSFLIGTSGQSLMWKKHSAYHIMQIKVKRCLTVSMHHLVFVPPPSLGLGVCAVVLDRSGILCGCLILKYIPPKSWPLVPSEKSFCSPQL